MRTPLLVGLVVGSLCLTSSGCRGDNDPHVVSRQGEFSYVAELTDYNAIEDFDWDTSSNQAWVEFRGFNFHGSMRVEIFDDDGDSIYDETFNGGGHVQDTDFTDSDGHRGEWRIVLTSTDVDGRVTLFLTPRF